MWRSRVKVIKNSRKCSVTFYWKVTCEGHVANIILFEFLYMENI